MYHILLPVAENEAQLDAQLDTLTALPGQGELRVTVLHVHEEIDTMPDEAGKSVINSINDVIDELQGVPDTVERAAKTVESNGIPVEVLTRQGKPTDCIIEVADETDSNAILIAGRTRTPVGKAVFGSVTQG